MRFINIPNAILLGLTASNFLYQAIGDQLWKVAIERSFFQAVAIVALAVAQGVAKR